MTEGTEAKAEVTQSEGDVEAKVDVETLLEQVKAMEGKLNHLKSTNDRLLNESKDFKTKYVSLREEVENKERSTLEEKGKHKELLELERNKRFETEEKFSNLKKSLMKERLVNEVRRYAKDAHSVEDVVNSNGFWDGLEVDEESMSFSGVKERVEAIRNDKPYLFHSADIPAMANARPATGRPPQRTLKEMSMDEKLRLFSNGIAEKLKNN